MKEGEAWGGGPRVISFQTRMSVPGGAAVRIGGREASAKGPRSVLVFSLRPARALNVGLLHTGVTKIAGLC